MNRLPERMPSPLHAAKLAREIATLARTASIEVNVQDEPVLGRGATLLAPGTRIYVSHLPGQAWEATATMCRAVRAAGFEPVPHLPVRLVPSADALEHILGDVARAARPRGILLVSGDYAQPAGPFGEARQALATGALERHGYSEVSLAGHPEGHPKVPLPMIRAAEAGKPALAAAHGLSASILTQFLFEPEPFIEWSRGLRASGVAARLVCGLAGPAKIATLFRYATRCGVGASIRALGARPGSLKNLLGDLGPDRMLQALAEARLAGRSDFDSVHFFSFGGFVRTAEWIASVAAGRFTLREGGGFSV
jgi:methylenetetrahydrofolate reductase (NADPH)